MDMAITAMGIKKINKSNTANRFVATLLTFVIAPTSVLAGDWLLVPNLNVDETFTDNVELTSINTTSSFITQTIAGLGVEYDTNLTTLHLSGTQIYAIYSHNSELNKSFRTLDAEGQHSFWRSGPTFTASANIANVSQNSANNSLADLVSGDTVEQKNYSTGLNYNFGNSSYLVTSSITYSTTRTEDNIGDNNGLVAEFSSKNGNNARHLYWQLDTNYNKRKQQYTGSDGEDYTIEALFGAITSWNLNPFIRYYDENIQGTGVTSNLDTTPSWGPGVRWLATPHIIVDLSYNFVEDETVSENYFDVSIDWEPSGRTSLTLGYSQRFFGEAYNLNLQHRTKRFTNSISYSESLQVFDRNTFQETTPDTPELIESNEYSLNKNIAWSSQLQLSRTSFILNVSADEKTSLDTNIVDDTFNASINVTRTISLKSNFSLSAKFNYFIYDKENPSGSRQEDYYRTISANFSRNFASTLSCNFTMQHINRDSTIDIFSYEEVRAIINITKEF